MIPLHATNSEERKTYHNVAPTKQPAQSSIVNDWHIVEPRKSRPRPSKANSQLNRKPATQYSPPSGSRFHELNKFNSETENRGSGLFEESAPKLFVC